MSKGAPKKPAAVIRAEQKFVCAKAELYAFDHGERGSKETKWAQVRSNFGGFATKFVAQRPSHPVWDAYLVTPVERLWMQDAKASEKMSGKQLSDRGAEAIAELRNVYMPLARKLFPNGMKSGDTKWDTYNEKLNNALFKHYEVKLEKDRNRKTKTPQTGEEEDEEDVEDQESPEFEVHRQMPHGWWHGFMPLWEELGPWGEVGKVAHKALEELVHPGKTDGEEGRPPASAVRQEMPDGRDKARTKRKMQGGFDPEKAKNARLDSSLQVARRNARVLENSNLQLARGQQLDELKLELQLADTPEEKADIKSRLKAMIADKIPDIKHTPPPKKKTDKDYDDTGSVPAPEFEEVDETRKEPKGQEAAGKPKPQMDKW
jgi:hypothetical protein